MSSLVLLRSSQLLGFSCFWKVLFQKEMILKVGTASPVGWGLEEAAGVGEACNCPRECVLTVA